MEKIRINKFISHNTNYSRREADELIKQGKVSLNGCIVNDFSVGVSKEDKLKINGKFVNKKKDFTMIIYHKPKGELVTNKDDRGRRTIFDSLPRGFSKFVSIGRLDFASEGLLLLTDAPAIATALMKSDIEREYYLKVKGEITPEVITAMREGFFAKDASKGAHSKSKITSMEFKPFLAYRVFETSGGYTKVKAIINEGQNRELRRFFGYFDLDVVDLKRTAFGRITLSTLKPGKWRYFETSEYDDLRDFMKENGVRH
ncbi:rRNA pseudouridine synthase [Campylobacter sp. faydin G-140]|uniref:pseudouridine synthase n=1 Tax=Campylobacter anatolicus TaxID=2829105 RepID=UPI001B95F3F0|nr:pseudouridine synthase [Campylobacter anatolicus]MBR8466139.1 rRNA pseudouridine synthase [Campylobacter anatolicus]